MRFVFIIFLHLALLIKTQGQQAPALIGPQFDYSNSGNVINTGTGLNIEGWFGDHFSLNYSVLYGYTGPNEYYLYTGGGQAAGVYLIGKAIRERSGLALAIPLGIVAFILPESYGFRIPVSNKSQLGLFLAPYGFEYRKNRTSEVEDYNISFEIGCRYYLEANKWIYIVPQIGMKTIYGDDGLGLSLGLSVMFKAKKKEVVPD